MSSLVTSVKIAVDSGAMDAAIDKAKDLNEEAGVKLPAGLKAAGVAAGAITTAMGAAFAAAELITQEVEQQTLRGYDFYNTVNNDLRPAMIYVAETIEAQNAALDQQKDIAAIAAANLAIGWNNAKVAAGGMWQEYGLGLENAEAATERFINDRAMMMADAEYDGDGWGKAADIKARAEEIANDIRAQMVELNDAAETLSTNAGKRQLLELKSQMLGESAVRQEQFKLEIEEREAMITLAANEEQQIRMRAELETFKESRIAYNNFLDQRAEDEETKRQQGIQREIDTAIMSNMNARDQIDAQWIMFEDDLQRRVEAEELTLEQAGALRKQKAIEQNAAIVDIHAKANEKVLREITKNAREMGSATSSMLSILDDDIANLFDSLNSLVSVMQNIGAISGGGGFWGMMGGIGTAAGGASTYNGGVNVGSLSVTVNGGGGSKTAASAQEGVQAALSGFVKNQMTKEMQYGGVLNPSTGVSKV